MYRWLLKRAICARNFETSVASRRLHFGYFFFFGSCFPAISLRNGIEFKSYLGHRIQKLEWYSDPFSFRFIYFIIRHVINWLMSGCSPSVLNLESITKALFQGCQWICWICIESRVIFSQEVREKGWFERLCQRQEVWNRFYGRARGTPGVQLPVGNCFQWLRQP